MAKKKVYKNKTKKGKKTKNASSTFWNKAWFIPMILGFLAILLYSNTANHGYVLDDDLVCLKNEFVQRGIGGLGDIFTKSWYEGFTGEKGKYYRPLMLASFAIEKTIFGSSAKVHHIWNVLYYALSGIFLFYLLMMLFKDKSKWFAALVAALFIAHPLHTEVVANIKGRDEILAFLGLLSMIYFLIKYVDNRKLLFLGLSLFFYFFSILTKEAAVAFLGVVPLILYFFSKENLKTIGLWTLIFGGVAGLYFLIRSQIVLDEPITFSIIDNSLLAADNMTERVASTIGMLGKYIGLLIFPHPLSYDYSYNQIPIIGLGSWKVWVSVILIGLMIYGVIKGIKSKHPLAFGILFMGITFSITSNVLFLTGATFAERFMYTPSLGYCIILGWSVWYVFELSAKGKAMGNPILLKGSLALILFCFSLKTISRNKVWKNDKALFSSGILTAPNSSRVQSFYGNKFYQESKSTQNVNLQYQLLDSSILYYKRSIEILPSFTETYQHLALSYEERSQLNNAIQTYRAAIAQDPDYFPARTNLGIILYESGDYEQSVIELEPAAKLAPNNATVQRALGKAYEGKNEFIKAAQQYEKAVAIRKNATYLVDLVALYRDKLRDTTRAIEYDKQIKELTN